MWVEIKEDQIKSVAIGAKIRVNGQETVLTKHYLAEDDKGFDLSPEVRIHHLIWGLDYCHVFGHTDWTLNKVEVWVD